MCVQLIYIYLLMIGGCCDFYLLQKFIQALLVCLFVDFDRINLNANFPVIFLFSHSALQEINAVLQRFVKHTDNSGLTTSAGNKIRQQECVCIEYVRHAITTGTLSLFHLLHFLSRFRFVPDVPFQSSVQTSQHRCGHTSRLYCRLLLLYRHSVCLIASICLLIAYSHTQGRIIASEAMLFGPCVCVALGQLRIQFVYLCVRVLNVLLVSSLHWTIYICLFCCCFPFWISHRLIHLHIVILWRWLIHFFFLLSLIPIQAHIYFPCRSLTPLTAWWFFAHGKLV